MAKPIPLNRRWVQNQQARAQAAAEPDAAPLPAEPPAPPVIREQAQSLRAIVCAALDVPEPDDEAFDAMELVRAYLQELPREADAVLYARFESRCPGCGEPIHVGEPITRHPQWGRYVHARCQNRQQRAAIAYTIVARYPGVCRHCMQPIHPGERITQVPRLGWVHEPCAQQRQREV
jgi:hypothetical protein